ncbi:hypothetical protein [Leptolyngbya sp. FACHB-261]|uniref:hypothetical protein n=1 Tax=Leptolyngbya sp. FACHB-261 TaxID=2692806 RepID=UPI00168A0466|nr:hypothetical protein [Leptolyngbya sp. FACHB-261]MBD2103552.1 hypothetical protein [Leptolyngbya sp. FACHB-261]
MAAKTTVKDKLDQYRRLQEQLQQIESEINIPTAYRDSGRIEEGIKLQSVLDGLEDLGLSPHQLADYMAAKKIVARGYAPADGGGKAYSKGPGRGKTGTRNNQFSRLTGERREWLETTIKSNPNLEDDELVEMLNEKFSGNFSPESVSKLVAQFR